MRDCYPDGYAYWYDRNPLYFHVILRYLRTGKVELDLGLTPQLFQDEAEFYGLNIPKNKIKSF